MGWVAVELSRMPAGEVDGPPPPLLLLLPFPALVVWVSAGVSSVGSNGDWEVGGGTIVGVDWATDTDDDDDDDDEDTNEMDTGGT